MFEIQLIYKPRKMVEIWLNINLIHYVHCDIGLSIYLTRQVTQKERQKWLSIHSAHSH